MVSSADKWMRIFDIPEISKHKKGFTIYKVLSMLYPAASPEACTKITVWKRFNDFKKLHREMKILHGKLNIKDKYPSLPNASFFKRFNEEVVNERRQSILNFLDFVKDQPQLFTCNEFVKFFESSHMPVDQLNGNISSIKSDLNLPADPEYLLEESDAEPTISDNDSIASSLGLSTQGNDLPDSLSQSIKSKSKLSLTHSISHNSKNSDSASVCTNLDSMLLLDGEIICSSPPNTPLACDNVPQYIIDASMHINMAKDLESEQKFNEAFIAYKAAIDILLKFGKEETDYDRKQLVHYKTEKYLIKAEKIYNMYLSEEMQNLKQIEQAEGESVLHTDACLTQRPLSDLYKYKVIKAFGTGMLVLHSEFQQLFYVKVIHKTMEFLCDVLILPENVPYMVRLYNYYNCENALFLVLEYCSGKKLWEYIKERLDNSEDTFYQTNDQILRRVQELDMSDVESEHSYSELINDYTINKTRDPIVSDDDTSTFVKVDFDDVTDCKVFNLMDEPIPAALVSENKPKPTKVQRKSSEISSIDEIDVTQNFTIPVEDIVKWAAQLLLALEKLHLLGVICSDLRSENLMITEKGNLKLTFMCNVNEIHDILNENLAHLAPEMYSFQKITPCADWWCFGAILYELLVGMPISTIHPDGLTSYTVLKIPRYVSPEGRSLLRQLLKFNPEERLGYGTNGTANLKSHPFFHSISWDTLLEQSGNC